MSNQNRQDTSRVDERIDAYIRNKMTAEERADFVRDLADDPRLHNRYNVTRLLIEELSRRHELKDRMAQLDKIYFEKQAEKAARQRRQRWITALSIAACAIVLIGVGGKWLFNSYMLPSKPVCQQIESANSSSVDAMSPDEPIPSATSKKAEVLKRYAAYKSQKEKDKDIHRLEIVDRTIRESKAALLMLDAQPTLTAEQLQQRMELKRKIYEGTWERIQLLVRLGRTDEAEVVLMNYKSQSGAHQQEARELYQSLAE